eukprot:192178_1
MALKSRAVQEDIHIITVAFILLSVSLDQANANMDTNINPNNIFQQNTTDYSMATEDSTILQSKQEDNRLSSLQKVRGNEIIARKPIDKISKKDTSIVSFASMMDDESSDKPKPRQLPNKNMCKSIIDSMYTQLFMFLLIALDIILYFLNKTKTKQIDPSLIEYITLFILFIYCIGTIFRICENNKNSSLTQINSNCCSRSELGYYETNSILTEQESLLKKANKNENTEVIIDKKYVKVLTGRTPKSMSMFSKSTATIQKEISHEFDRFIYILMGCGVIALILGIIVLSKSAMLVTTFAISVCICSFWYCSKTVQWIMSFDRGITDMQIIADFIKEGANSYLKTQYKSIAMFAIFTSIFLLIVYLFRTTSAQHEHVSPIILAIVTAISFLIGSFCSALAGYTGVWTSVRVNLRVAAAASKYDYANAFLLSFNGGAVSAIISASMCILGITILYIIGTLIFVNFFNMNESEVPLLLGGYGFGASFVALFMQLGGGIYRCFCHWRLDTFNQ